MSTLFVAFLMLSAVIGCILWKKIPVSFAMMAVPVAACLALGYSLEEISTFILDQFNNMMTSAGYMLLFGLLYFTMLTETGLFDTLVTGVLRLLGGRMNAAVVLVLTTVLSALAYLTSSITAAYFIVLPLVIPLYKRYGLDRRYAFILCQTAIAAMCWLPWGTGMIYSSMAAGVSPEELAAASIPWGLSFLPVIALQWLAFSLCHRRKLGTLGLPAHGGEEVEAAAGEERPNARPRLFWFNLAVLGVVLIALAVLSLPPYLVFAAAAILTALVNYPQDYGPIWTRTGGQYCNMLVMMLAICFYLAAFHAVPADGSRPSMVEALAGGLTGLLPPFLSKYMFLIFLILVVPILQVVPYRVYNTMYPLFISVGLTFGFSSTEIVAPFVCNLALASSVTRVNSTTYVGCTLCEIDLDNFCKWGGLTMFLTNLAVIAVAWGAGVLVL